MYRLKEKTAEFKKRGMHLSQIRSVSEPLRLGRLQGNHFDLVVRDLKPHSAGDAQLCAADTHVRLAALVEEAVENVKVVFSIVFHVNSQRTTLTHTSVMITCVVALQSRGFVNYYGPQRFGSGQSVQSDRVGLALLKEDMVRTYRTGSYDYKY